MRAHDEFLQDLIVQGFNSKNVLILPKFFGSPKIEFAAIDCSKYAREMHACKVTFAH
jgi:hypothetical protein